MKNLKHRFLYNPLKKKSAENSRDVTEIHLNDQTSIINKNYLSIKKEQPKGVALLLAMTSLFLLVYVATSVTSDTTIEYAVNAQELNRIKAYYAARNSLEIALFRIKVFQQASRLNLPAGFAQQLNQIWQFPFMWPLPLSEKTGTATKESAEDIKKDALFQGQYNHTISDEGSKIDINDLASPSKNLRDVTKKQILALFESKIEADETFRDEYANFNFKELIGRMADWMSETNESENGGDKRNAFVDLGEDFPPNRGFRTLDELRLVPGMTEVFFNLLKPSITIYGSKAFNPNTANESVIKSIDSGLTEEAIKAVIARRDNSEEGGEFQGQDSESCRNAFKQFVEQKGARLTADFDKVPFTCDKVSNFKIEAVGKIGEGQGSVQKKITAYVMDLQKAGSTVKNYLDKEKQQNNPQNNQQGQGQAGSQGQNGQNANSGQTSQKQKQEPLPKGRPRILYWGET